jgi:UDP-N-acetylglucosamine--N-acetylmuramyl-(pentapeptide) pyrophosphoryl-undecaprenol N-acetylglucosamine transferase
MRFIFMRILFTGGGSGGHIFPIVAIGRELKELAEEERILELRMFFMGSEEIGGDLLKEEGIAIIPLSSGKWRRYGSWRNFTDLFLTVASILKALGSMFVIMPDVVFSKGGFGALPAVIAAFLFRIPLIIHESDAAPGKVNLFSGRFAKRIGVSFPGAADFFPKEKSALVGIPLRKRILGGNLKEAKESFSIWSELPVVGVMGASQGAQPINNAILDILKDLTDIAEVVHQTGEQNYEETKGEGNVILEFTHKERYHPYGFFDEAGLRNFYTVSDLIVSRAGGSSIYEIAAWGKPSIIIPLSHAAQDHQRKNGYEYGARGACIVIEEANLTPHILFSEIKKLLADRERMKKMGEAAQMFARLDAAKIIAREILKLGLH